MNEQEQLRTICTSGWRAPEPPPTVELLAELPQVGPAHYDPMYDDVGRGWGYYDRHGEPISRRTWIRLFELKTYQRIAYTEVGPYHVSTIWLGLDHGSNWSGDPDYKPWIYECMVFDNAVSIHKSERFGGVRYNKSFEQRRYQTEQEAREDHERIVEEIRLLVAANPDWQPEGAGYAPVDTQEEET